MYVTACTCDRRFSTGHCFDGDGRCECLENYSGPNCDQCNEGFYGFPNCKRKYKKFLYHSVSSKGNLNDKINTQFILRQTHGSCLSTATVILCLKGIKHLYLVSYIFSKLCHISACIEVLVSPYFKMYKKIQISALGCCPYKRD